MKLLLRILLCTKLARYRTAIGIGCYVAIVLIEHILCDPTIQASVPSFGQACHIGTGMLDLLKIPAGYLTTIGVADKDAVIGKALGVHPDPLPPENPYRTASQQEGSPITKDPPLFSHDSSRPGA